MRHHRSESAFSLVELSIVLVILGLLVGGVMSGQSLIKAAELRSVTSEFQQWQTAVNVFKDKYFQLPGDFDNATAFWVDEGNCAAVQSNSHTTALSGGTCDGGGDGRLAHLWGAAGRYEAFLFWHHLQMAGLISGQYSGVRGSTDNRQHIIGVNAPRAKFNNAGWSVVTDPSSANVFDLNYGSIFIFGNSNNNLTYDAVLTPEEAWNIDTKMDDGKPSRGNVIAWHFSPCAGAASNTDYDVDYLLAETSARCALIFRNGM